MPWKTWQAVVSQTSHVLPAGRSATARRAYVRAATVWARRASGCHDGGISSGTTPRRYSCIELVTTATVPAPSRCTVTEPR